MTPFFAVNHRERIVNRRSKWPANHIAVAEVVCRDRIHYADADAVTDETANTGDIGLGLAGDMDTLPGYKTQ